MGIGYIQLALTHCTNIYQTPTTERGKEVPVDELVTVLRLSLPSCNVGRRLSSLPPPGAARVCPPDLVVRNTWKNMEGGRNYTIN